MIYFVHSGRESLCRDENLALYYWLLARCPSTVATLPQNESPVEVKKAPKGMPQPGQVVPLALAACEREFGKTPTFDATKDVNGQCRDILEWLKTHGDITQLEER